MERVCHADKTFAVARERHICQQRLSRLDAHPYVRLGRRLNRWLKTIRLRQ